MEKNWPFGFFVYSSLDNKEESAQTDAETPKTAEVDEEAMDPVEVVWAETPSAVVVEEDDSQHREETVSEEFVDEEKNLFAVSNENDLEDDDEEEDLPDLEEELEIALEAAHEKEVKKHRLITGITASVALLGAAGLVTGFAIRSHLKKK